MIYVLKIEHGAQNRIIGIFDSFLTKEQMDIIVRNVTGGDDDVSNDTYEQFCEEHEVTLHSWVHMNHFTLTVESFDDMNEIGTASDICQNFMNNLY